MGSFGDVLPSLAGEDPAPSVLRARALREEVWTLAEEIRRQVERT